MIFILREENIVVFIASSTRFTSIEQNTDLMKQRVGTFQCKNCKKYFAVCEPRVSEIPAHIFNLSVDAGVWPNNLKGSHLLSQFLKLEINK